MPNGQIMGLTWPSAMVLVVNLKENVKIEMFGMFLSVRDAYRHCFGDGIEWKWMIKWKMSGRVRSAQSCVCPGRGNMCGFEMKMENERI